MSATSDETTPINSNYEVDIDGNEESVIQQRMKKLIKRFELQKKQYKALSDIVLLEQQPAQPTPEKKKKLQEPAQPTPEKKQKLEELLKRPNWKTLEDLVTETKDWDAASTIPKEKSFLCHTHLQKIVDILLANSAISFEFLKLIIERFEADNEVRIEPNLDAPIHYAVHQLNGKFLDWLLNDRKLFVNLNSRNNQKETALAILCSSYDKCMKGIIKPNKKQLMNNKDESKMTNDQRMEMLNTIRILIKKLVDAGADFNICSQQLKLPFELLRKHSENDKPTKSLVDWCVQKADRALVICRMSNTNERVVDFYNESPVKVTEELLEICLRYKDQASFEKHFGSLTATEENVKKVIEVVLHTAVEQKMSECVRKIDDRFHTLIFRMVKQDPPKGNDENAKTSKSSELVHRVEFKGLLKKACLAPEILIARLLIGRITDSLVLNDDPLLALTLTKAKNAKHLSEDREALLAVADYLAAQQNIFITKSDNSGNTPLHLALKYGFHDIANTILKQRYAYIGMRNRDNMTPLDYGGYDFWKNYLDSCIVVDTKRSAQDRNVLMFNLNCLEPYKPRKQPSPKVATTSSSQENESCTQVCVHWLKCNSCKNSAGGHSRIAAGAEAASQEKDNWWSIVQKASRMKQPPNHYTKIQTEMTVIRQIAESKDLKPLLVHPIIYTFIMVKWIQLSHWMYLNLLLTFATMVFFGWHSLDACSGDTNPALSLKIFASLFIVLIALRELLQLSILRKSYVSFENLMDIVNIIGMIVVLSLGCIGWLSSILMISFALQLIILFGSLPFKKLPTIMYMFMTVSLNFLISFLVFVPLIGSFIFAFYLTYNAPSSSSYKADRPRSSNNTDTYRIDESSPTSNSFNNFSTFWDATIKTLVMTTGEFDAADIDFSGGKLLLFLIFLFFAPIVILNLINGLAVSDIAAIRQESELISISKKVLLLERYERGIVNVPVAWVKRFFPESFFWNHTCWIHVRTDQFRKILVHIFHSKTQESSKTLTTQTKPSAVQSGLSGTANGIRLCDCWSRLYCCCSRSTIDGITETTDAAVRGGDATSGTNKETTGSADGTARANDATHETSNGTTGSADGTTETTDGIARANDATPGTSTGTTGSADGTTEITDGTTDTHDDPSGPSPNTTSKDKKDDDGRETKGGKEKPTPISLSSYYPLSRDGTDTVIKLLFFKVPTFLTLNRAITDKALAVIEQRFPSVKQHAIVEKRAIMTSSDKPAVTSGNTSKSKGRNNDPIDLAAVHTDIRQLRDMLDQLSSKLDDKYKKKFS